jgi:hypothetical protein
MDKKTSFIHENRNYVLIFLFIVFILVLIIFYNFSAGGTIIPEGSAPISSGNIGVDIGNIPPGALEKPELEEASMYDERIINQDHNYGLFETTLKSMGFYERDGETLFRVDIWVHNVGENTEEFMWDKANIQQVPNKRWDVASAVFDGSEIPSGGEREGYLLFKDVPEDLSGDISVNIGNSVAFSTILGFTSQAPHKYELIWD